MKKRYLSALVRAFFIYSFLLLFLFSGTDSFAQYMVSIGSSGNDGFNSILHRKYGGAVAVGSTTENGNLNVLITKVNFLGGIDWTKTYGGSGDDEAVKIIETSDHNYVVIGYTASFGAGEMDAFALKIDTSGNILWSYTYGQRYKDYISSVIELHDKSLLMIGRTNPDPGGSNSGLDNLVIKVDSNGKQIWAKSYGGFSADLAFDAIETSDLGYLCFGSTASTGVGKQDSYMFKLNADGDLLWDKTLGGTGNESYYSVIKTSYNKIYASSSTWSTSNGDLDAYLSEIDENGNVLWEKTYGGSGLEYSTNVQETSDGRLMIAGNTSSFGNGGTDLYFIKLDTAGNMLWNSCIGGKGNESFRSTNCFSPLPNGEIWLAGNSDSYSSNNEKQAILIKTNLIGAICCDYNVGLFSQKNYKYNEMNAGLSFISGSFSTDSANFNKNDIQLESATLCQFIQAKADFSYSNNLCAGDTVQFQNLSSGADLKYIWEFGDPASGLDDTSHAKNPSHVFSIPGTYLVKLIITSNCSADTKIIPVVINTNPIAFAGLDTIICRGKSIRLRASGGDSYFWSPSNGLDNPNSQNPVASPNKTTIYTVAVSSGTCTSYDSVVVNVIPAPIIYVSQDTSICNGDSAYLSASGGDSYVWSPTTGLSNPFSANPKASPSKNTTYHVRVISKGFVCDAEDSVAISIASLPHAEFSYQVKDKNVLFFGTHSNKINSWAWNFGDRSPDETGPNPEHNYLQCDVFTVTLTVTSPCGIDMISKNINVCKDTTVIIANVSEPKKTADYFSLSPNPFRDQFTIHFNSNNKEPLNCKLYNMIGEEMIVPDLNSLNHSGMNYSDSFEINLSGSRFKSGIYFLVIQRGNEQHSFKLNKIE